MDNHASQCTTKFKVKHGSTYRIYIIPILIDKNEALIPPVASDLFVQPRSSALIHQVGKPIVQAKEIDQITIKWENEPSHNHSSAKGYQISCYEIASNKPISSVFYLDGSSKQYTFTSLSPNTSYFFGVKAVLHDKTESSEVYSDSIKTLHISNCRVFMVNEIHCNHVVLQWEVPDHIANEVEYYSIQYRCSTSDQLNYIPDTIFNNHYTVKNLDQNTSYVFQLQAAYCVYAGDSMPSHEKLAELCITTDKTQSGPPGKPEFKIMQEKSEVEIKWQRPTMGYEHVQGYELYSSLLNGMQPHKLMQCEENFVKIEHCHFDAEEKYAFKVRAICSNGNFSDFSERSKRLSVKRRPQVFGKPKVVNRTSNSIQLKWNSAKYFKASKYKVKYNIYDTESNRYSRIMNLKLANWQYIETSNEVVTISDLKPDTSYVFKVKAKNELHSDEYGPASELSDPIKTLPPPPTELVLVKYTNNDTQKFKLTWNAPVTVLSPKYRIMYSSKEDTNKWLVYSKMLCTATEAEINELKFGMYYRFQVQAYYINSMENSLSDPSDWYELSHPIPSQPQNPMITDVDQDSVLLKWNKPTVNGEYVESYNVYKRTCCAEDQQSDFELHKSGISEEIKVTGLTPDTKYQFQIEALNSIGQGGKIESIPAKTLRKAPTPPGKPYMLQVTHDMVKVAWEKPVKNPGMVSQYEVYYKICQQAEDVKWMSEQTQSNNTSEIKICNLDHSTEYIFKVRLITENIDDCAYSEESEPVTTKSALPSQPGKPKGETNSDGSITLSWARPEDNFKDISHYIVEYHQEGQPGIKHPPIKTEGAEEQKKITDDLCHNKGYYFSVRAVTKTGELSKPSLLSDLITNHMTLAAKFLPFCEDIGKVGNSKLHLLPTVPLSSESNSLRKFEIKLKSHDDFINPASAALRERAVNKVLMLVGASGAGKSTLLNAMINYIMRVEYGNHFRLKLIHEANVPKAESVTKHVSAYVLHYESGFAIPYTLTIIDTPGFGDTAGLERDKKITQQIKEFFSAKDGITHLDGVGFVCQSSVNRLTPAQQYIFDSILAIFGNDVKNNIFIMCTFSDGIEDPQVIEAVKRVNIPVDNYYEFNNSALYSSKESGKVKSSWDMGIESFRLFFEQLETAKAVSIQLTKDVLQQREQLEAFAIDLKQKIQQTMIIIDELKKDIKTLNQLQEQDKNGDGTGEIEVEDDVVKPVELPKGEHANICMKCQMTCHDHCQYGNNRFRNGCTVMERKANGKMYCSKCPGACYWRDHKVVNFRYEKHKEKVTKTFEDITGKYAKLKQMMGNTQDAIECLKNEIDSKFEEVFECVKQAKDCRQKLDKIALLPSCFVNVNEYIDLLIAVQMQEKRDGYNERIEQYKLLKERSEIFTQMGEFCAKRDKDGKRWWEKRFLE